MTSTYALFTCYRELKQAIEGQSGPTIRDQLMRLQREQGLWQKVKVALLTFGR